MPNQNGPDSLVVSPHPHDLDRPLGVIDLIHKAVLDIDAAGIGSRQISDELFVGRRILKRVLRDDVEKPLRLWLLEDASFLASFCACFV